MKELLEEVFVTEGVPQYTFVKPPNYNDILLDIRRKGKPVIIEGQSGTGKTTTAKKIIHQLAGAIDITYLTARNTTDVEKIVALSKEKENGYYIIDDFHRLSNKLQTELADIAKVAAETQDEELPKLIIIGINQVGSSLIHMVHDIAKRCGIHRIEPGNEKSITELIQIGAEKLNVQIESPETIYEESKGDYWLTQSLCQAVCSINDIIEEQEDIKIINFEIEEIRDRMVSKLAHSYKEPVKEFARGKRFRPSNDPYFKLLKLISSQSSSIVDLNELANAYPDFKASINGIKEKRLNILLESKPICSRYFYYNQDNKNFAIEDPALFYYLKHVDWEEIRKDCGFRESIEDKEFEIAISFAGENRELAKYIAEQLEQIDVPTFYDELYESNYLGKAWSKEFERIFVHDSRFVVCLLDENHKNKIWPTFERDCFRKRVAHGEVIPIFLDDTVFVGIPDDIVGFKFKWNRDEDWQSEVEDKIVFKIWERLE
ncbi:TIR domain-containing protein [Salinimicrobium tongyeongense]|uniref:TIR domain-containing protein n=1 Tax=Salinimicrobium tongyeongense TaxID=2809707 RepID=A0ABY6NQ00_9FLAO|nr:TIR domain-containing protein [Salinimicrobium tongyeongense]UZH54864.1 TIR domain-containing protein [Salinimicrobium tongyeongense]